MSYIFPKWKVAFIPLLFLLVLSGFTYEVKAQAIFSGYPTTGCSPLVVNFNNSSIPGTYDWDFGDGSPVSHQCSPTHIYAAAGTYTCSLTVNGTYVATQTITVNPSPTPSMTGDSVVCLGSSAVFTAASHFGSTYSWSATNGTWSGSGATMTFYPTLVGYCYVSLTETNSYGCSTTIKKRVYVAPLPSITLDCNKRKNASGQDKSVNPGGGHDGQDTTIIRTCRCAFDYDTFDMGSNGGIGTTYTWTIVNGTIITGQGTGNVVVQWGGSGTSTLTVVGENVYGCKDSGSCIFDICPGASFVASGSNACLGNYNSFTAVGSGITSWYWDFGDGSYSTLPSPTHQYTSSGVKTVKVGATNTNGCYHDTTFSVYVNPSAGPPVFCPGTVCEGSSATYYSNWYSGATYGWVVDGDVGTPVISANGDTITVVWGSGPVGTIKLKVTGGPWACTDTVYISVPIVPHVPPIYGNNIVCPGGVETYSAPILPGTQYTWTVVGGSFLTSNTGYSVDVHWNTSLSGTHSIKVSINNTLLCCKGENTLNVTVLQVLHMTGPTPVCANSSANYYLPAGVSGTWLAEGGTITYTDPGGNYVTVLWGASGTGHVSAATGLTAIYCNPTVIMDVNIMGLPVIPTINGALYVCRGSSAQYTFPKETNVNYVWNITGGVSSASICSTATTDCRNITFSSAAVYTITVTATYNYYPYCSSVGSYTVHVVSNTVPTPTGNLNPCEGSTQNYTIGSNPGDIYEWQVIGGTITSGTNISPTISVTWGSISPGIIIVRNKICGTMSTIHVNIKANPVIVITMSDSTCAGDSITLTAYADTGSTYSWSPGGYTTPSIRVPATGTYTVTVNDRGCINSQSIAIPFPAPHLPNPTVYITTSYVVNPTNAFLYEFDAHVTNCSGCVYQWKYYPSGTPVSGGTGPTIFVTDTLQYQVTVTNSYGCSASARDSIDIHPTPPGGGCDTTVSHCCGGGGCLTGGSMTLTSMPGASYLWSPGGATTQSITVTSPGTYCVDRTISGTVYPCCFTVYAVPVALFTYTGPPCNTVSFTNISTGGGISYWDFGDGTYSNDANPVHVYNTPGTYTVQLSVSNGYCWNTVTHTFTINKVIVANFTATPAVCPPTVTFNSSSSIILPAGGVTYSWNFGDGVGTSTAANPTYTYNPGTSGIYDYNVTLLITNGTCSSTVVKPVRIHYLKAAIAGCPACVGQSDQFVDNSYHSDPIIGWSWNFGDGSPVSGLRNPWHVYTATGTYTIHLTVMDVKGCSSTDSVILTVSSFTAGSLSFSGPTTFCDGGSVTMTAPAGFEYIWNTGATTAAITVSQTGLYTCICVNAGGCKDTLEQFVTVNPNPVALVEEGTSFSVCGNSYLAVHAQQDYTYTNYSWTDPAGGVYTGSTMYLWGWMEGTYTLTVTNSYGCTNTTSFYVDTISVPTVSISPSSSTICFGASVTLTASVSGGTPTGYSWFNGANTASITFRPALSGPYWVDVTFATGGCTARAYTYITVNPVPDLSLIPKGCYKVCKGYTPVIYGPNPPPGHTYQYYWYQVGNPVPTTGNPFTITGITPASYYVIVKDPATGCTSQSEPFSIDYVDPPVAGITSSGTVICSSAGNTVTLTATGGGSGYTYTWSTGEHSQTITTTHAGVYWVKVSISDCCFDMDSIIIDSIGDCCWDSSVEFTIIPDGYVINTPVKVWKGKYFVNGVVHVKGTTEFDLTEVDIVFSKTGEIRMEDNTFMRANTSVFRPCHILDYWVGFTFQNSSAGYIDKCVYKNATNAIHIQNDKELSVRIIDNTFIDCYTGIRIENKQTFGEGITGNTFTIDNHPIFPLGDRYGIFLDRVFMEDMISQNFFRNADRTAQNFKFYGIYMRGGKAVISNNTFTNMYRSIDASRVDKYLSVENNKIEVTQLCPDRDVQIRVSDTRVPLVVFDNEIYNSAPTKQYSASGMATAAVYIENNSLSNIKENHIKGYDVAIWGRTISSTQIIENLIERTNLIGVLVQQSTPDENHNVDVACNRIYMNMIPKGAFVFPVGIFMQEDNQSDRIRTNCIFDCYWSIYTSTGSGTNLPDIRNNYMFNYFTGVNNSGHNGAIGVPGPFNVAGRNSFISNNQNAALDIASVPVIFEDGNYSVVATSGVVSTGGNYPFNSTAACGQQFTNPPATDFDEVTVCNHYDAKMWPSERPDGGVGNPTDPTDISDVRASTLRLAQSLGLAEAGPLAPVKAHEAMDVLYYSGQAGEFEKLYNYLQQSGSYTTETKQRFELHKYILENDVTKASNLFSSIKPVDQDEAEWMYIQSTSMRLRNANAGCNALTGAEVSQLSQIDDRRGTYAAVARDMVNMSKGEHPYIFGDFKLPETPKTISQKLNLLQDEIAVIPNPNNGVMKLRLSVTEADRDGLMFQISDAMGNIVFESRNNPVAGEFMMDLSHLSSGMYTIAVRTGKKVLHARFTKL